MYGFEREVSRGFAARQVIKRLGVRPFSRLRGQQRKTFAQLNYFIIEAITNHIALHAHQDALVRKGRAEMRKGRVVSHEVAVMRSRGEIALPILEGAHSVQSVILQVLQMVLQKRMEPKTARLLLYAHQIASSQSQAHGSKVARICFSNSAGGSSPPVTARVRYNPLRH